MVMEEREKVVVMEVLMIELLVIAEEVLVHIIDVHD